MIDTFKRVEDKYPMTLAQAEEFLCAVEDHIHEDTYAHYTVHSLYLDTGNSDLIIHSLDHPKYKMKLRLRSYGDPQEGDPVYLETKKKYGKIVYKRRIALEQQKVSDVLRYGIRDHAGNNTADEIGYLLDHYHPVPKVLVCYDRLCFASDTEADVRITFDQKIRFRLKDLSLKEDGTETPLTGTDTCIMEIKAMDRYPLWLVHALRQRKLYKGSFSKYGTIYRNNFEILSPHVSVEQAVPQPAYEMEREAEICSDPF